MPKHYYPAQRSTQVQCFDVLCLVRYKDGNAGLGQDIALLLQRKLAVERDFDSPCLCQREGQDQVLACVVQIYCDAVPLFYPQMNKTAGGLVGQGKNL